MKYKIGDLVTEIIYHRQFVIIATREQNLDRNYLEKSKPQFEVELNENDIIKVENGFDYKAVELTGVTELIFDKQTFFENFMEDDLINEFPLT